MGLGILPVNKFQKDFALDAQHDVECLRVVSFPVPLKPKF